MSMSYKRSRRAEYPAVGEQLDAILKAFNQMRLNGIDLTQEMDDLLGRWLAVKAKYPKKGSKTGA